MELVLFSDIRLYREGLAFILSRDGEFRVVGSAESPLRTVELVRELRPDVALIDTLSRDSTLLARERKALRHSRTPAAPFRRMERVMTP